MEKAILKTLIYADIFDYPLNTYELHKWLINKKLTLRQIEKIVNRLRLESLIQVKGKYYFLPKREKLVGIRNRREKQSKIYLRKVKLVSQFLKLVPWIKLVGISGGLALDNVGKNDDIDLFIITGKNRLWMSRMLAIGIISLLGQRRKKGEKGRKIAGKLCINILLEEDRLEQRNKDIFVAHEVLQMKVLWQRGTVYSKYLMDNEWAFKFLPNWVSIGTARLVAKNRSIDSPHFLTDSNFAARIANFLEVLAKKLQLKIMGKPQGMERIEDGALYFHPEDCRMEVLAKYQKQMKKIISP